MLASLPLLSLILLFLLFFWGGNCWRSSVLLSVLAWGLLVTFVTEGLSIFNLLAFGPLLMFWTLTNALLIWSDFRLFPRRCSPKLPSLPTSSYLRFLIASIVIIVALIGTIALIAPPNNWDSMTYHMSRVVHWIQNRSVAHYPTSIPRQLYSGPWAGYAITHLQILSGGDRFANLIQWFSMAGSIFGVSLIAQQLGANLRGQIFAAVVCATIPMGILQGSSTQTDYVVSFWLVCFVYFALLAMQDKMTWKHLPAVGASFGLALLSKGTAYVFAFPFFVWLVLTGARRLRWHVWKPVLAIGAMTLAVNYGYYQRNLRLFGSVLGASAKQGNQEFSLGLLLSNIVRNLALHLSTPVRSLNLVTIRLIELLHQFLGLDVNDPRITSPPGQKFDIHSLINHEDLAGNPLHLLIIVCSVLYFVLVLKQFRKREQYFLGAYILAIATAFVLFCALVLWSPWRSRVHLPLFVLSSAFVGVNLSRIRVANLANFIALFLIGLSSVWVLFNESRPMIMNSQIVENSRVENIFHRSRLEQYFLNKPELLQPYVETAQYISSLDCPRVGLAIGGDTWEYPLWVLLQKNTAQSVRIEHMNINSLSTEAGVSSQDLPCVIVASKDRGIRNQTIVVGEQTYTQKMSEGPIQTFSSNQEALSTKRVFAK